MSAKIRLFNPSSCHLSSFHLVRLMSLFKGHITCRNFTPIWSHCTSIFFQVKEEHFRTYPHWKWCQKDRKKSPRKGSDTTESADSMSMLSSFFYLFDYKFKMRKNKSLKKVIITPHRHFDPALLRDLLVLSK